ncbi:glutaredoxin family protein [Methanolobus sp. WCC5]|uniref:glutaredoxin family protein n=1 Tax=Methanolobus sp. WCC5 TaxID=3125785 RepID=UPI00324F6383
MDTKKLMDQFKQAIKIPGHKPASDDTKGLKQENGPGFETENKKVTIYALSTCPWCKKARKFFTEKGIDADYIEYDKADEETRKYIQEDCKSYTEELGFPIVKIGDDAVVGYNTKKYSSLLDR